MRMCFIFALMDSWLLFLYIYIFELCYNSVEPKLKNNKCLCSFCSDFLKCSKKLKFPCVVDSTQSKII